ncbi:hypothetical protein GUJ93_ZPchr0010g8897 [Zizania palustris]|uniref:Uncharacterized protein n=1 Tax=Zizania palustris TaxID=103762 RepID=A0A8J5WHD2_ZIZPA|nr:hypothetical protein GUJ93_ZPchr0010g8897 [Zizania palustris]
MSVTQHAYILIVLALTDACAPTRLLRETVSVSPASAPSTLALICSSLTALTINRAVASLICSAPLLLLAHRPNHDRVATSLIRSAPPLLSLTASDAAVLMDLSSSTVALADALSSHVQTSSTGLMCSPAVGWLQLATVDAEDHPVVLRFVHLFLSLLLPTRCCREHVQYYIILVEDDCNYMDCLAHSCNLIDTDIGANKIYISFPPDSISTED